MKHLFSEFQKQFNDWCLCELKGNMIHIGGIPLSPRDIIDNHVNTSGDHAVWNDLFSGWLDKWKEQQIEKANSILGEYRQEERFSRLTEHCKDNRIIPFIGAGLSMSSGYPGWTSFLNKLQESSSVKKSLFNQLIKSGLYEEAAQQLSDNLGVLFDEQFENFFVTQRPVAGPVQLLPYIFKSIITTNYDSIIERSFSNSGHRLQSIIYPDGHYINTEDIVNKTILVHLHGIATNRETRIITSQEYEDKYSDANDIRMFLYDVHSSYILLFLGCSLEYDRPFSVFQNYVQEHGHKPLYRHYAFLEAKYTTSKEIKKREQQLSACNIFPIWYPPKEHDESITALLIKLHEDAQ